MTRLLGVVSAAAVMLLWADLALAKGPPTKATIGGPGLSEPVEITHPRILEALAPGVLENWNSASPTHIPGEAAPAYELTRCWGPHTCDRLRYYPNEEGPSALLYVGLYAYGSGAQYGGRWFIPSEESERILRQVIAHPPDHVPSNASSSSIGQDGVGWLIVVASLLGAALIAREARMIHASAR